jgi:hypothetical protein
VNLETDILARTVVHLLQGGGGAGLRSALPDGLNSWDELARLTTARRNT